MMGKWCGVALLVFLLAACHGHEVGGPCRYEKFDGVIEVVSVEHGQYRYRFEPQSGQALKGEMSGVLSKNTVYDIPLPSLDGAVAGDRFQAAISLETEGTCTPIGFSVGERVGPAR